MNSSDTTSHNLVYHSQINIAFKALQSQLSALKLSFVFIVPSRFVNTQQQSTATTRQTLFWVAALMLSVVLLSIDCHLRIQKINTATQAPTFPIREPAADPTSPSGYQGGIHTLVLPNGASDSCHWILQTEQMFSSGEPRIRHVNYDNAPAGREVHWASPYRWWIGSLAWLLNSVSNKSLHESIALAALYSNPLMLLIALLVATPWVARKFGSLSAALFCLGLVGMLPTFDIFNAGAPDHHGLACLCGLFSLLFLLVEKRKASGNTRLYVIASGIAGGLGLWISAVTQTLVLVGIGLGAILSILVARRSKNPAPDLMEPRLWLTWAQTGTLTSLATYAVEYLPSHTSWRLEVNHPLYALAWLGAGQLLSSLARLPEGKLVITPKTFSHLDGAALLAVLVLPLVILINGTVVFVISDPFLWALHKNYIDEFQNVFHVLKESFHIVTICSLLPFSLLLVALITLRKNQSLHVFRPSITLAFIPGILLTLFAVQQIRWLGLCFALLLAGLIFVTSRTCFALLNRSARRAIGVLILLAFIGQPLRTALALQEDHSLTQTDLLNLSIRDLAQWLRFRAGSDDVVVASSPTLTTPLIYFGGIHGVGTFYWENREGLKTCAALFSAASFDDAERIVRQHGITHIVLASWDSFVREYVELGTQGEVAAHPAERAFAARLVKNRSMPPWLRLIPYQLTNLRESSSDEVLVFEVVPAQSTKVQISNFAHYFVDMGLPETARQLLPALEQDPLNLHTTLARARVHLALQNRTEAAATLASLPSTIPVGAQLDLDESLHFAALQMIAGHAEIAEQQLIACMGGIAPKTARKLSPSAAYALLALSRQFRLPLPAEIANLATALLAPGLREQFSDRATRPKQ